MNTGKVTMTFHIDKEDECAPFEIEPRECLINPGKRLELRVSFSRDSID